MPTPEPLEYSPSHRAEDYGPLCSSGGDGTPHLLQSHLVGRPAWDDLQENMRNSHTRLRLLKPVVRSLHSILKRQSTEDTGVYPQVPYCPEGSW